MDDGATTGVVGADGGSPEGPFDQLTARLADELAVRDLVAHLAHLADMGDDLEVYLDWFTDDAVWEFPGNPALGLAASTTVGREAIAADRVARRADGFQGPGTGSRHVNTTLSVRIGDPGPDGAAKDTAVAESYWLYVADDGTGPAVRAMGAYRDSFRRTPGGWKLAHRRITAG